MAKLKSVCLWIMVGISFCVSVLALAFSLLNTEKSDETIYDENINKVVEIRCSNDMIAFAYGTGCFVSTNGEILTNKHLVYNENLASNFEIVQVRLPIENDFIDAKIVKISEQDDLALIKIEKTNTQYFDITKKLENGQEIYTIGNPNGFGLSFTKGNVSSKLRNITYEGMSMSVIQTTFVINDGNSGGPVFDKNGFLIGLISFRLKDNSLNIIHGVSFAVPASQIIDFLK